MDIGNDDHYRRRVLTTLLAPNLSDPPGQSASLIAQPDDEIQLIAFIVGGDDVMHCVRFSERPVGIRRRPIRCGG
jgi:hypothetical protein